MRRNTQQGFTLIELMIALIIGLLITAAAFKLFYTGLLSNNIQQAGSELVDNSVFGADYLTRHMQRANLGSLGDSEGGDGDFLNHLTALGGIVLTAPTDMSVFGTTLSSGQIVGNNLRGLNLGGNLIPAELLSKNGSGTASDQLTIQYRMREAGKVDCMGRIIPKDNYVIERYFVRSGGLACAAAIYAYDEELAKGISASTATSSAPNTSTNKNGIDISTYTKPDGTPGANNLAGDGQIIVPNVENFQVLMGLTDSKKFAAKPSELAIEYRPIPALASMNSIFGLDVATGKTTKRIVAMQIGLLMRADNPIQAPNNSYKVLDQTVSSVDDGKMRDVYTSNILIRNARGVV